MRFSKSKGCFFPETEDYPVLPEDIVVIPNEDYEQALARHPGETLDVVGVYVEGGVKYGRVIVVPAPIPTFSDLRISKWEHIKAERDRRIQAGGYKVGAKWFHSDTFSRTQQMGLVMLGANIQANTPWKTMDGTTVTMTQALAGQIFATAAASDIAIFAAAEAHRAAMEASADPSAYDFSTGWPKVYGE